MEGDISVMPCDRHGGRSDSEHFMHISSQRMGAQIDADVLVIISSVNTESHGRDRVGQRNSAFAYTAVQWSAVQNIAVQCRAVSCSAMSCSAVSYSAVQYSAIQYLQSPWWLSLES